MAPFLTTNCYFLICVSFDWLCLLFTNLEIKTTIIICYSMPKGRRCIPAHNRTRAAYLVCANANKGEIWAKCPLGEVSADRTDLSPRGQTCPVYARGRLLTFAIQHRGFKYFTRDK